MQENECTLVGNTQVAAERQRRLALYFVAEDRDGSEVAAQGQLVAGEQRAAGDAEILFAATAAIARRTLEAAAIVGIKATAAHEELAQRLKKHGLEETKASITNKLARGTFPATFFLACIAAMELEGVALEEI